MKRIVSLVLCSFLALTSLAGCSSGELNAYNGDRLIVYTSFYTMYDLTVKIGGDKIQAETLVQTGVEPHDWEPSTNDIQKLENADLLVYNGAGMESWVDKIASTLSNEEIVFVETTQGISLLTGEDDGHDDNDDDDDHDHGEHDPHIWLDPSNAIMQMQNIQNALSEKDPGNQEYYAENFEKYKKEFEELDREYREAVEQFRKQEIVVSHQAYGYLCNAYGLKQIPIQGLSADAEPSLERMASIVQFVQENDVQYIFFEELINPKVSETIAVEAGVQTAVLNPIEGLTKEQIDNGDDYLSIMRQNLENLKLALN